MIPYLDINTKDALNWIKHLNNEVHISIKEIPLKLVKGWRYDPDRIEISHTSGKFFSIKGLRSHINGCFFEQPIIVQPEHGILGFMASFIDDEFCLLCQGKIEPGNVNYVQISPTVQATKSNYTQVHRGRSPHYVEYFLDSSIGEVIFDSLQSEQGSRFLAKRNRNIIIYFEDYKQIPVLNEFKWISLKSIKELMTIPNIVNMDARTVISGITLDMLNELKEKYLGLPSKKKSSKLLSEQKSISRLMHKVSTIDYDRQLVPLGQLEEWKVGGRKIEHKNGDYFQIIGVDVKIGNREVVNWQQPMIKPAHPGLCGCLVKETKEGLEMLLKLQKECGNRDFVEYGPTVQCLDFDYRIQTNHEYHFIEEILSTSKENIIYDAILSEEGGRFYKDQNRYMIVKLNSDIELPSDLYQWVALKDIYSIIPYGNIFNIQLRSLISVLQLEI